MVRALVVCICSVHFFVLGLPLAWGQSYPSKQVRIICAAAGGGTDFVARLLAPVLTSSLGEQIIVDNRGGSVSISVEAVTKSPPDGHTLLLFGSSVWLDTFLSDDVRYDPVNDLAPITFTSTQNTILVVHPSLPVKTVPELIALAKARPGALNYASAQDASPSHLAAELLKTMAGIDMVRVGYKGTAPALTDLLSGQTQLMFVIASVGIPQMKAGRVRALAVTSPQRSSFTPELPTVAESGLPGYTARTLNVLWAPPKTPAAIINRLNQEFVRALNQPAIKERFANAGIEPITGTPEQVTAAIKADMARLGKIIKDSASKK